MLWTPEERHTPDQHGRIRDDFLEEMAVLSLKGPLGWMMWRRAVLGQV